VSSLFLLFCVALVCHIAYILAFSNNYLSYADSTSPPRKQQAWSAVTETSSLSSSTPRSSSTVAARSMSSFFQPQANLMQMKLCGNYVDPNAAGRMNIAIALFLHSHCLPFSLATDPKLAKIIEIGRILGPNYKPPHRNFISGKYLNVLYSTNWTEQMKTLLSEACVFGLTLLGDGATIKTVPLVNVLVAGINNPFALLNIADCTDHLAKGGKKDARYIAKICMPLIKQIESAQCQWQEVARSH